MPAFPDPTTATTPTPGDEVFVLATTKAGYSPPEEWAGPFNATVEYRKVRGHKLAFEHCGYLVTVLPADARTRMRHAMWYCERAPGCPRPHKTPPAALVEN